MATYQVPTNVLLEQGRASRALLQARDNQVGREALALVKFDVDDYLQRLNGAIAEGEQAEVAQERAKNDVTREHREDRAVAEEGFRWILRLQTRVRSYLAADLPAQAGSDDLRDVFRFGRLPRARPRGVLYELRILIPEAEEQQSILDPFGVDAAFIEQGKDILVRLGAERDETDEAKATRKALTRRVRAAEKALSSLLRQLDTADEGAALEHAEARRWFPLSIIAVERGRVEAARAARAAHRAATDPGPDAKDD